MGAIEELNSIKNIGRIVGLLEIVDGLWILLATWAALLAGRLPRALNYLGVAVGVAVGVAGVLTDGEGVSPARRPDDEREELG